MFLRKCRLSKNERDEAAALGIKVVNDTIKHIAGRRGGLPKELICTGGRRYSADVVFYKLGYHVQSKLAERLGCKLDERYVKVGSEQQMTMPSVYAAGDVDTDRHFVVLAAAAGARVAISIYEKLLKEAVKAKVEGHKSL
ncbi:putative FAD-dependent pyridine nucleotide-disulfide oxidoreductase [Candidatus Nitrososphaera gargensis Ga9.2]|uniref:Putative FAD-dependent pyridine nucleotide-disulfide oxidoreductase n=1 Tax=Nitrososphaera gargensis (strain Ga9.2) TaxID=1237085 RepID=K0INK7_NITGG|nr:FAD-dependent oxidoreductase [Candidatus Nitrososphaera gargensis]AFU59544.1 putative FAD-dependent pyridine nucleotide-disulfide oxidoreductase [Candidatus Nitrososphaera gargensis Ga9.2]